MRPLERQVAEWKEKYDKEKTENNYLREENQRIAKEKHNVEKKYKQLENKQSAEWKGKYENVTAEINRLHEDYLKERKNVEEKYVQVMASVAEWKEKYETLLKDYTLREQTIKNINGGINHRTRSTNLQKIPEAANGSSEGANIWSTKLSEPQNEYQNCQEKATAEELFNLHSKLQFKAELIHRFATNKNIVTKGLYTKRMARVGNKFNKLDSTANLYYAEVLGLSQRVKHIQQAFNDYKEINLKKVAELMEKCTMLEHAIVNKDFIIKQLYHKLEISQQHQSPVDKEKKVQKKSNKDIDKESIMSSLPLTPQTWTSSSEDSIGETSLSNSPDEFDVKENPPPKTKPSKIQEKCLYATLKTEEIIVSDPLRTKKDFNTIQFKMEQEKVDVSQAKDCPKIHNKISTNLLCTTINYDEDLSEKERNNEMICKTNTVEPEKMQYLEFECKSSKTDKIIPVVPIENKVERKMSGKTSDIEYGTESRCSVLIDDLMLSEDSRSTVVENFCQTSSETKEKITNKCGSGEFKMPESIKENGIEVKNVCKNTELSTWLESVQLNKDEETTDVSQVDITSEIETQEKVNKMCSSEKFVATESVLELETNENIKLPMMIRDPRIRKFEGSTSADISKTWNRIEEASVINKVADASSLSCNEVTRYLLPSKAKNDVLQLTGMCEKMPESIEKLDVEVENVSKNAELSKWLDESLQLNKNEETTNISEVVITSGVETQGKVKKMLSSEKFERIEPVLELETNENGIKLPIAIKDPRIRKTEGSTSSAGIIKNSNRIEEDSVINKAIGASSLSCNKFTKNLLSSKAKNDVLELNTMCENNTTFIVGSPGASPNINDIDALFRYFSCGNIIDDFEEDNSSLTIDCSNNAHQTYNKEILKVLDQQQEKQVNQIQLTKQHKISKNVIIPECNVELNSYFIPVNDSSNEQSKRDEFTRKITIEHSETIYNRCKSVFSPLSVRSDDDMESNSGDEDISEVGRNIKDIAITELQGVNMTPGSNKLDPDKHDPVISLERVDTANAGCTDQLDIRDFVTNDIQETLVDSNVLTPSSQSGENIQNSVSSFLCAQGETTDIGVVSVDSEINFEPIKPKSRDCVLQINSGEEVEINKDSKSTKENGFIQEYKSDEQNVAVVSETKDINEKISGRFQHVTLYNNNVSCDSEGENEPLDLSVKYAITKENKSVEEISTSNVTEKTLDYRSPLVTKSLTSSETNNISPDTTTISPTSHIDSKKLFLSPLSSKETKYPKLKELSVPLHKMPISNLTYASVDRNTKAESPTGQLIQHSVTKEGLSRNKDNKSPKGSINKLPSSYVNQSPSQLSDITKANFQAPQRSSESQGIKISPNLLIDTATVFGHETSQLSSKDQLPATSQKSHKFQKNCNRIIKQRNHKRKYSKVSSTSQSKDATALFPQRSPGSRKHYNMRELTSPKYHTSKQPNNNTVMSQICQRSPGSQKHYNMRAKNSLPNYCDTKRRNLKSSKKYKKKGKGKLTNMCKNRVAKTLHSEISYNKHEIHKLLHSTREERGLLPIEQPDDMQGPLPVNEPLTIRIPSTDISTAEHVGNIYKQLTSGGSSKKNPDKLVAECKMPGPSLKQAESTILQDISSLNLGNDYLLQLAKKCNIQDTESKPFDETLETLAFSSSGSQINQGYKRKSSKESPNSKRELRSPYSLRNRTRLSDMSLLKTTNRDVEKMVQDVDQIALSELNLLDTSSIDLESSQTCSENTTLDKNTLFAKCDFTFKSIDYGTNVEDLHCRGRKKQSTHLRSTIRGKLRKKDLLLHNKKKQKLKNAAHNFTLHITPVLKTGKSGEEFNEWSPAKCRKLSMSMSHSSSSAPKEFKSSSSEVPSDECKLTSVNNTWSCVTDDASDNSSCLVMDIDKDEEQSIEGSSSPIRVVSQTCRMELSKPSAFTSCSSFDVIPKLQPNKLTGKEEPNVSTDQLQTETFSKKPYDFIIPSFEPMSKAMCKYDEDLPNTNVDFSKPKNRVPPISKVPADKPVCDVSSSAPDEIKITSDPQNEVYKPKFYVEYEQSLNCNIVCHTDAQEKQKEVDTNSLALPKIYVEMKLSNFVPKGEKIDMNVNILRTAVQKHSEDLIQYRQRNIMEGRKHISQVAPVKEVEEVSQILEPFICEGVEDMVKAVQAAEKLRLYSCCVIFNGLFSLLEKETKNMNRKDCEAQRSSWLADIGGHFPRHKAPPLHPRVLTFVGLCTLLNDQKKRLDSKTDFIKEALHFLEDTFLQLNDESEESKGVEMLMFLGFVYVSLARLARALSQVRRLMYDILYCYTWYSFFLAYIFLKGWPEILLVGPVKNCGDPIALVMIHALTTQPEVYDSNYDYVSKKSQNRRRASCRKGPVYRFTALQALLWKTYKYNSTSVDADKLFELFYNRLCQKGVHEAIILLSKKRGTEWFKKKPLHQLIELVQQWRNNKTNDATAAAALNVIGCVVRSFNPARTQYDVQPVFQLFRDILSDENTPDWMQETVIMNVCRLSRLNFNLCTDILVSWKPSHVSQSVIDKILVEIIAKRSEHWWTTSELGLSFINKR